MLCTVWMNEYKLEHGSKPCKKDLSMFTQVLSSRIVQCRLEASHNPAYHKSIAQPMQWTTVDMDMGRQLGIHPERTSEVM